MTYKDLHVHVDNGDVCGKRLHAASDLARQFDSHLTGVYVRRPFTMPIYAEVPISDQVLKMYSDLVDEKENSGHALFEQITEKYGIATSWRTLEGRVDTALGNEARYSDLLVLGQPDPDDEYERNRGLADQLVLTAGRPCLIIPYIGAHRDFGKHPLIAWDGGREASRAIHDALPLLEHAERVSVLTSNPEKSNIDFGDLPGSVISHHLARHDIKVEVKNLHVRDIHTSDAIMSHIADNDHDLLVMGAYGHSRIREVVLGGMTREVMAQMTVPVFMSH